MKVLSEQEREVMLSNSYKILPVVSRLPPWRRTSFSQYSSWQAPAPRRSPRWPPWRRQWATWWRGWRRWRLSWRQKTRGLLLWRLRRLVSIWEVGYYHIYQKNRFPLHAYILQVGGSVPGGRSGLGWRWTTATSPTSVCSSPRLGRRWRGPAWTSTPGSSPPPTRQSGLWATVQPPSSTAEILFRQHRLPSPCQWLIILLLWDFVGAPTTYPPTSCSSLILVILWVLESVAAGFHSHQRRKDWGLPVLGQLLRVRWSDLLPWLSYPSPPPGRWRHSLPHHWGRGTLRGLLRALVHHALCRTQTGRQLINILYTGTVQKQQ